MHSAHTHGLGCAHPAGALRTGRAHNTESQHALGHVVARIGAVSWLCCSAHWPCHACTLPCREPPFDHDTKTVSRPNSCRSHCAPCHACARPYRRPCRNLLLPCRNAISQPCWSHIAIQTATPNHDIIFVSRLTRGQTMHARARRSPLRTSRPYRGSSWPYLKAISQRPAARPSACSAVSWHPWLRPAALCHDTICCIVT